MKSLLALSAPALSLAFAGCCLKVNEEDHGGGAWWEPEEPASSGRNGGPGSSTRDAGAADRVAVDRPPGPDARTAGDTGGMLGGSCDAGEASTCARCSYDHQCPSGGRCRDGRCQRPCAAGCGTGDLCQASWCEPDPRTGGRCITVAQCTAGGSCINGYCHGGCARDTDCPNRADFCDRGLCRSDTRPRPSCRASSDCASGQACVDGTCRPACDCDADCTPFGATAVCSRGYCFLPAELATR